MNILFDKNKVREIETSISETIKSLPVASRCGKIIYSPCFKPLFSEERILKFISEKYKVFTIKNIFEVKREPVERKFFGKIFEKIFHTLLGFIPYVGNYISILILLSEISEEIIFNNKVNNIEKYLKEHWKKQNKYKKVKYIVFITNTNLLSKNELALIQILSFLISEKYISNTALYLLESCDNKLPYITDCETIKSFYIDEILSDCFSTNDTAVHNNKTILNIIGIDYIDKLNSIALDNETTDKTIETIINCILKEKSIDYSKDLERLLNSCSMLFEQFNLKDVEYVSFLQNNKEYQHFFTLAQKAEIIQGINLQKFYFLQPFIREFFQQKKNTLPSDFYDNLFNYLEKQYPESYEDLAIASSLLLSDDNSILSKNIIAYYYCSFTMPNYKLDRITGILLNYPIGNNLLRIDKLYNGSCYNTTELTSLCESSLLMLKTSRISDIAKLSVLSYIARLYYELEVDQIKLVEISSYYRMLLSNIKILSGTLENNWNFALDYIVFSTAIDSDYPTKNSVQRLVSAIEKIDVNSVQKVRYLKYLQLGNAIYPQSTEKAKELLQRGYILSAGTKYTSSLFAINYSASLIISGEYEEAAKILERILIRSFNMSAISMSCKNNYIIAKYLMNDYSIRRSTKELSEYINGSRLSDYCICINNYVSFKILSGKRTFEKEFDLCNEVISTNDIYHCFYAKHNMLIIYFLTKDEAFWELADNIPLPYLQNHYQSLFTQKISFLKANFHENWDINQLSNNISNDLKENGFENVSHFNTLPVLFGMIERWFE